MRAGLLPVQVRSALVVPPGTPTRSGAVTARFRFYNYGLTWRRILSRTNLKSNGVSRSSATVPSANQILGAPLDDIQSNSTGKGREGDPKWSTTCSGNSRRNQES